MGLVPTPSLSGGPKISPPGMVSGWAIGFFLGWRYKRLTRVFLNFLLGGGSHFHRGRSNGYGRRRGPLSSGMFPPCLTALLPMESDNLLPTVRPTTIAHQIAQSQHRVYVGVSPTHASLFHTTMNHNLVAALHRAGANRVSLVLEMRIVNQLFALLKIAVRIVNGRYLCLCCGLGLEQLKVSEGALGWGVFQLM